MCSIFGFVARRSSPVDLATLRRIIGANIARGPHAFGFAWIDSRDRLHCFKSPGRLTDHLKMLPVLRDARMLVGHLRYATHGDPQDNTNNHPHPCDGGWLVHNGVVGNYRELVQAGGLLPTGRCDSELIARLIERSDEDRPVQRAVDAVERTDGSLAILSLWARPGTLVAARRGNPLHFGMTASGLYLATLRDGLPGIVRAIPDHTAVELDSRGVSRRVVQIGGDAFAASLYDSATYRGG